MTTAYNPITQPRLSDEALVDGDLCDIVTAGRYCFGTAHCVAVDADSRIRILCVEHAAKYFPASF